MCRSTASEGSIPLFIEAFILSASGFFEGKNLDQFVALRHFGTGTITREKKGYHLWCSDSLGRVVEPCDAMRSFVRSLAVIKAFPDGIAEADVSKYVPLSFLVVASLVLAAFLRVIRSGGIESDMSLLSFWNWEACLLNSARCVQLSADELRNSCLVLPSSLEQRR